MFTDKVYYLSGPMRGYPQYNYPAFSAAAADLRGSGFTIISPAEGDSDEMQRLALASACGTEFDAAGKGGKVGGETAGEILARDVRLIHDKIDGIVFLPDWWKSRGAKLEAFVGLMQLAQRPFEFYNWDGAYGCVVEATYVRAVLRENMP